MIDVNAIWDKHKLTKKLIVKTKIREISHFECFLATNYQLGNIFLILRVAKSIVFPDLSKYRFKSILVYSIENENSIEFVIFLSDIQLKHVFSVFIQDILESISHCITEEEGVHSILNTISRWKKMFEKITPEGLTLEQQKGLMGELLFFNYLLDNGIEVDKAIDYWTSVEQDFRAKDFSISKIAVEIKFTSSEQPKIQISSERQLDREYFDHLFVVLYVAKAVKSGGFSLNSIIERTKNRLVLEELHILFNNKLLQSGYFDKDKESYNKMFTLEKINTFYVSDSFPKITTTDLNMGVSDVSYSIQASVIGEFIIDNNRILDYI